MAINFLNTVAVDDNVLFVDTINDRVGIGTDSPDSLLEISQQLSATATIDYPYTISSRDDGNSINQLGGEGVGIKFRIAGNDSATPGNSLVGASIAAIRESHDDANSSAGLGFFITQNNETLDEAVRIDHDGNVGIGTTSPTSYSGYTTLQVDGSNGAVFRMDRDDNAVQFEQAVVSALVYYKTITDSPIWFGTNNTERMRIDSSGNVGIGTTSPGANLAGGTNGISSDVLHLAGSAANLIIEGSTRGQILLSDTGANSNSRMFGLKSENDLFELYSINDDLSINTDNILVAKSDGNVGIGMTSPTEKFQVYESGLTAYKSYTTTNVGAILTAYQSTFSPYTKTTDLVAGSDSTVPSEIRFLTRTNGTSTVDERMRITSSGNVGIGETLPGEKLDVNGNIKIKNALLSNQENTDIDSAAAEVVAQVAHATYTAAFFDFVVKKGTNVRSGTVYACHNGDTTPLVEFTETSTNDLGDTSDVVLSVDISGANMRLLATVASDDWSVKSLIRAI